jgi:hypothetical protein
MFLWTDAGFIVILSETLHSREGIPTIVKAEDPMRSVNRDNREQKSMAIDLSGDRPHPATVVAPVQAEFAPVPQLRGAIAELYNSRSRPPAPPVVEQVQVEVRRVKRVARVDGLLKKWLS